MFGMDCRKKVSFALHNIKTDFVQPWWRMFTWWYAPSLYIEQITLHLYTVHDMRAHQEKLPFFKTGKFSHTEPKYGLMCSGLFAVLRSH
jgi:hypothetical protein